MTGALAPAGSFDIVSASVEAAVAICFPKSRSGAYPTAVNICRSAGRYNEAEIEGVTMHFAAFARERMEMARALAVLSSLRGYKGLLIYAGGRLLAMSFQFKIQAGHPSSEGDQIQAGAIREGCAWCPNFRSRAE